ncbi:2346_t:CDS:2 [Entrophospora sp. SA101]|nr:2346_t:CDS:2 [Entrophospora sp. SA101]CAJ0827264.1 78_t:CDS:2 [Entrophospora sp. SA101]
MFMIRRQLASLLTRAPGLNAYHPERECMPVEKIDRVSETASDWEATAVVDGKITKLSLEDFAGKFIVLVFYPFDFTYVADYKKTISKRYSVLSESMGAPLRGLIIIDNERKIRVVHINDAPIGRSVDETLRLLDAIKHVNEFGEAKGLLPELKESTSTCDTQIPKTSPINPSQVNCIQSGVIKSTE